MGECHAGRTDACVVLGRDDPSLQVPRQALCSTGAVHPPGQGGDDIIGIARTDKDKLQILKGESKSRAKLSAAVLDEAGRALDSNRGRPTRHSVLFVAERLRESGNDSLAEELEEAVLASFRGIAVAHMLFVVTGGPPRNLLEAHLKGAKMKKRIRHAIGVRIEDHQAFIELLYGGL